VSDLSVSAKAIGISETDLVTALRGGTSIAAVAKQHGVAVQKVIDALVADAQGELAAAVKTGRITQAQADQVKADLVSRIEGRVNAPGGAFRPGPPFGRFGFGPFGDLSVAAKAIGISEADLVTALRGGSSIAAVAKQHGVADQKVIDALVADARSKLAAAVKAGRITQTQADAIAADLPQRIAERVDAPGFDCGPGHPGMGMGGHGWLPGDGSEAGQASA
jgi:transposase-like protein